VPEAPVATAQAIRAVTDALRAVLDDARVAAGITGSIVVFESKDFADPLARMSEGISVYLRTVSLHGSVRNLPPRVVPDGTRRRPSLPLDLHYLVTAWARSPLRQQELLGFAIRALEDQPVLASPVLNQAGVVFREGEAVTLVAQPTTPSEWVALWEFNKGAMQPSMPYVAQRVLLDSELPVGDLEPVTTRVVEGVVL
jgi:hypothetical protein